VTTDRSARIHRQPHQAVSRPTPKLSDHRLPCRDRLKRPTGGRISMVAWTWLTWCHRSTKERLASISALTHWNRSCISVRAIAGNVPVIVGGADEPAQRRHHPFVWECVSV